MSFWTNLYNFLSSVVQKKSAYFEDLCSSSIIHHKIALFEKQADIEVIIPC